ncbi:MAG: TIGR04282 family arsenosugar biosynthesis glycosyltransferase [Parvibaculum sp.]|nr:TIGR04282 family arsenosugar biosynthesis glycosyltransferase [Parvibaculum sp.]
MSAGAQLVVMVKHPELGRVKTRLAKGLGAVAAARFYRQTTDDVLRRVGDDPRWQTAVAVAPDRAVHERVFARYGLPVLAQGTGDLGVRMGRLMRDLPVGPVVIVGSDIPDISAAHIAEAFKALGRHEAVFGPADDGGYWLVGLRRRPRIVDIFNDVRWSCEHTLDDTLRNVARAGLSVAMLGVLSDIDTRDDYLRWKARQT